MFWYVGLYVIVLITLWIAWKDLTMMYAEAKELEDKEDEEIY